MPVYSLYAGKERLYNGALKLLVTVVSKGLPVASSYKTFCVVTVDAPSVCTTLSSIPGIKTALLVTAVFNSFFETFTTGQGTGTGMGKNTATIRSTLIFTPPWADNALL